TPSFYPTHTSVLSLTLFRVLLSLSPFLHYAMKAGKDRGYTITQVSKNDTSSSFKISKGLFNTEQIFYLKRGKLNNYIIDISAPDASKIGPQIYQSLKEHN
ncbi:MAG: hypothetical protein KHZ60_10675, partial [Alistipes sp.]|uniref:hypothetical protein n=1 Tax=Alistipes sp. TaxID=1872444 RepID=UPI001DC952EA